MMGCASVLLTNRLCCSHCIELRNQLPHIFSASFFCNSIPSHFHPCLSPSCQLLPIFSLLPPCLASMTQTTLAGLPACVCCLSTSVIEALSLVLRPSLLLTKQTPRRLISLQITNSRPVPSSSSMSRIASFPIWVMITLMSSGTSTLVSIVLVASLHNL